MRLSELGELGLLAELERRGLAREIENDAAQLSGGRVVTNDVLVQEVHFRLEWTSYRDLGYRAAAVNLSDLAASGAEPEGLIVGLGAPPETPLEDVIELYEGLNEPGVPILGGDTTASERLFLSVTALGRSERVPGRAGARPGDLLVVTGPLGAAGAAFREQRHSRPPLRLDEGRTARGQCQRADRPLRRSRPRRRPHRAPVRLPPRDRARTGPAGAGRRDRRSRLRRGLRALGGDTRPARIHRDRPLCRGRGRRAPARGRARRARRLGALHLGALSGGLLNRPRAGNVLGGSASLRAEEAGVGGGRVPRRHLLDVRPLLRHPDEPAWQQQRPGPRHHHGRQPGDRHPRPGLARVRRVPLADRHRPEPGTLDDEPRGGERGAPDARPRSPRR